MSAPTIGVDEVSHRYGGAPALTIERLVMERGTTAVLGPNGSGKSTLLRLLATLTVAQVGTIRVDGLDPADPVERTAIRRRLGYVAQHDGLPARMRVREYCDDVGALKEIGPARLRRRWTGWSLGRLGLAQVADDRIGTLSGGMQRRLTLAQALLGQPDLLVLDEPLTSLDAEYRGAVTTLLVERSGEATIVVATHHADELATVSSCSTVVTWSSPVSPRRWPRRRTARSGRPMSPTPVSRVAPSARDGSGAWGRLPRPVRRSWLPRWPTAT